MKKILFAAVALAALFPSSASLAQRAPQGPMTRDEFMAMQKQRFAAMDTNHDGIVTREELSAQIAARMGNTPSPDRVSALLKLIDTDGDGKATAAEADASAAARFTAMDTDHDGTLTPEERRAGMAAMMGRQ